MSQIIKVKSSSITDLKRASDTDKVFQSDVIGIGISDHCLIFCTKKVIKNVSNKHNTVKLRPMMDYTKEAHQINLLNADWN